MRKIDIYCHFYPAPYFEKLMTALPQYKDLGKRVAGISMLHDLDERFRAMDLFGEEYCQILSLTQPPPETLAGPDVSPDWARAANDGFKELCDKYPDRFPGFVARLPLNNMEAAMKELKRAIEDLGAVGLEITTNINDGPIDQPQFAPLWEEMEKYDLPIWMHPIRDARMKDYLTEDRSKHEMWWVFGWPYETSIAMSRFIFSGILDRHPNLKIITHHMGGMIPYFAGRIGPGLDVLGTRTSDEDYFALKDSLKKRPFDYFKENFYADTAVFGAKGATLCGLDFFGEDKIVFASDSPFDPEGGTMFIRETIKILDELEVSEETRAKIYHKNAEKLLKLDAKS